MVIQNNNYHHYGFELNPRRIHKKAKKQNENAFKVFYCFHIDSPRPNSQADEGGDQRC